MSIAVLCAVRDFYTMRKAYLINYIMNRSSDLCDAMRQSADIAQEKAEQTSTVQYNKEDYDEEDEVYEAMREIEDEYAVDLADITAWETELQLDKQTAEAELAAINASLESINTMIQQNIKKDAAYGENNQ